MNGGWVGCMMQDVTMKSKTGWEQARRLDTSMLRNGLNDSWTHWKAVTGSGSSVRARDVQYYLLGVPTVLA